MEQVAANHPGARPVDRSALIAAAGGLLLVLGAILPWASIFAGLKTFNGLIGPFGWGLLIGGSLVIVGATISLFAPTSVKPAWLPTALPILGGVLGALDAYLIAQLVASERSATGMAFAKLGPGLFVAGAGAITVIASSFARRDRVVNVTGLSVPTRGQALAGAAAALGVGAGLVHLSVASEHWLEYRAFGVFFLIAGLAQLAWAWALWARPSVPLLRLGVGGNIVLVALWVLSRTVGLPIGPHHWSPEVLGWPDGIAVALEAGSIAIALWVLRGPSQTPASRLERRVGWMAVASTVPLTILAVLGGTGALSASMHM